MNAIDQARRAYGPAGAPLRTSRSVELQAFSDITAKLRTAASDPERGFNRLVEALNENRRLWTILAADVADPGNQLSQKLRAQIFYLAEFTAFQTTRILRQEASADSLIDINLAIIAGLGQQGAGA